MIVILVARFQTKILTAFLVFSHKLLFYYYGGFFCCFVLKLQSIINQITQWTKDRERKKMQSSASPSKYVIQILNTQKKNHFKLYFVPIDRHIDFMQYWWTIECINWFFIFFFIEHSCHALQQIKKIIRRENFL